MSDGMDEDNPDNGVEDAVTEVLARVLALRGTIEALPPSHPRRPLLVANVDSAEVLLADLRRLLGEQRAG
ncbi:MAG: hypothetical protein Q8P41_13470 [Pseudomonadota bacterium]|nr:hypothetical protein [Pseudomonadota bacterium]